MRKPTEAIELSAVMILCAAMGMAGSSAARAQSEAGMRNVPARSVPVPSTVSPQMAKIIGAPLRTNWNLLPKSGEEWKPVADAGAAGTIKNVPGMMERLHVTVEKTVSHRARAFVVTQERLPP